MNFNEFKELVSETRMQMFSDTLEKYRDRISIKNKEKVIQRLMKIFDTTLDIANKTGFQAMSMRDLSRESGMSMGALYSYFSSKDNLLEMIQAQSRDIVFRIFTGQISKTDDPGEKLRTAVRTHIYISEIMQPWFYFSFMESKNLSDAEMKKAIIGEQFTEKVFTDIIESGIRDGIFSCTDPELASSMIKAMLQDWYLKRWKYRRRKTAVDDYADFVIGFVESAVIK
jgi:TetR/AcrR family transcriptional regulator, cholesterol catabolism regulator